ncbi:hypothetical protein ACNS7O_17265 (plasmid) [Haloferacaceae archaeon DSL9]
MLAAIAIGASSESVPVVPVRSHDPPSAVTAPRATHAGRIHEIPGRSIASSSRSEFRSTDVDAS